MWKSHMRDTWISEVSSKEGEEVTIAGWLKDVKKIGKLCFLIVHDSTGTIQCKCEDKPNVRKESAIVVKGKVVKDERAPGGYELAVESVDVVGEACCPPPFPRKGDVSLAVRLDNRVFDMRREEVQAVLRIRSALLTEFRTFFASKGFVELTAPVLIPSASEGGAEVFRVDYFDKPAFLAQSPQLYKQLAVISGMDNVFVTMPVFRAERHDGPAHINEIYQMDVECAFADDDDVVSLLKHAITHMLNAVKQTKSHELEVLGVKLDVPEVKEITYDDAVDLLSKHVDIEWGADFSREMENKLCQLLGTDLVVVRRYPTAIRAFYSMPCDDKHCKSFDLLYKGVEISSGAQRIHDYNLLKKVMEEREMDERQFTAYLEAFKLGAPPHAGWSMGLDRITMLVCGLQNIREAIPFPRDKNRLIP